MSAAAKIIPLKDHQDDAGARLLFKTNSTQFRRLEKHFKSRDIARLVCHLEYLYHTYAVQGVFVFRISPADENDLRPSIQTYLGVSRRQTFNLLNKVRKSYKGTKATRPEPYQVDFGGLPFAVYQCTGKSGVTYWYRNTLALEYLMSIANGVVL